ncbi:MAG: transposase [Rectinemataceae bacterium]|nr:transposase [Rectinemataceae bacterium]
MERIFHGRYTKEFREEAVKLVTEEGLSASEVSRRLELPSSTIISWLKAVRAGRLGETGKHQRQSGEVELGWPV